MEKYKHSKNTTYKTKLSNYLAGGVHFNFATPMDELSIPIERGDKSYVWDIDGNKYLDLYSNFGANIVGHNNKIYNEILFSEFKKINATNLSSLSLEVTKLLQELIPSAELIRFGCTGSEVVQSAIRIARAATRKTKFIRFFGNYHGHFDNILGGKPSVDFSPMDYQEDPRASQGNFPSIKEDQSFLLHWNDEASLNDVIETHHKDIACIITEPYMINGGGITNTADFLSHIRYLCDKYNILLIFDEIITGFRIGLGGVQKTIGIIPDLSVFGKAISGGSVPISLLAGKRKYMQLIEDCKVVQAGTFNGYHFGLAAVKATIKTLLSENSSGLNNMKSNMVMLKKGLEELAKKSSLSIAIQGEPSCFNIHITNKTLSCYNQWTPEIAKKDALFRRYLADYGVLLAPTCRMYPSIQFTQEDVSYFLSRANYAMQELKNNKLI